MIERDYPGARYSWLVQMLREGYNAGHYGGSCAIYVADHEDDRAITKRFDLSRDADLTTEFTETLDRPLSERGVRCVVVAYGNLCDLNFSHVGHIAATSNLEPSFLFAHFERALDEFERAFRQRAPALLPSDTQILEFLYPVSVTRSWYSHMTVTQSPVTTHGRVSKSCRLILVIGNADGCYIT